MNITYRRAVYTTFIFGFLFFFLIAYFIFTGPTVYLENKIHFAINALFIFLSLFSFAVMLFVTNNRDNIFDERDRIIQSKANSIGLIFTSLYVFLLCITLFTIYIDDSFVHVTWLWFIAYSTFAFAYFSCSLLIIYFYRIDE